MNKKILKRFVIIEVILSCIIILTALIGRDGILYSKLMTFVWYRRTLYTIYCELLMQTIIWLGFTLYYLKTKMYKELFLSTGIGIVLSVIGIIALYLVETII
jgi:hypothetical protein